MANITSVGVGSGLDVNSIVSSLMALERRPLQQLQERASTMQSRISAFGVMKSSFSALSDTAARLANAANWNPVKVDSSDSASVSATADSKAVVGKHTLEVERLAQGQILASSSFASSSTVVGTGKLKFELGTTVDDVFTAKSGSTPVEVTIGSDKQTLAGVRDAINAAKAGVTASIVNGSGGSQLVLRGADGAESSVRITATDDDGNDTDASGLSALAYDPAGTAGAGRNLTQSQAAQDAKFTLDGIALTSATNTPATVLDGVTLTLKKATTAPVTLTLGTDASALKKNVQDFVTAYNNVARLIKSQTKADPTGHTDGPLQADFTARALQGALSGMLRGTVTGLTPPQNNLNAIGVELTRDGVLQLDDKRFDKAMEDPVKLARLFHQEKSGSDDNSRGFAVRFQEWAKTLTADGGVLTDRIQGLEGSVKSNGKLQDNEEARIKRTEARLRAQYSRLDTEMSKLNGNMSQMLNALGLR